MNRLTLAAVCLFLCGAGARAVAATPPAPLSDQSRLCIACHRSYTPGIVADWQTSRHAITSPSTGQAQEALARRISADEVPEELREVAVGCYECHGLNPARHADSFEHFGARISLVVSPDDCATCHPVEATEYARGKKAHAYHNLADNPIYQALVETVTSVKTVSDGKIAARPATEVAKSGSCYACHGTEVTVIGTRTVETALGEMQFPDLAGWPNQGVGRVNPDGSLGSCASCHPRHSFSLAVARQPYTCSQCHLEPDVPAWEVYRESKHGNIMQSLGQQWNWEAVPWTPGRDFTAPTCATCHASLLADGEGDVIAPRTHEFADRLWLRLFGLIYSHPQPKSGDTSVIRNKDGLPLPTAWDQTPASDFLIDAQTQQARRAQMVQICAACHSTDWGDKQLARMEATAAEADAMVRAATDLLSSAWQQGLADPSHPFDEALEQMWVEQWLFQADTLRLSAAMMGPDLAAFEHGWWDLTHNLAVMREEVEARRPQPRR